MSSSVSTRNSSRSAVERIQERVNILLSILPYALKFYFASLAEGCSFVDEALPRALTLWFEHSEYVHKVMLKDLEIVRKECADLVEKVEDRVIKKIVFVIPPCILVCQILFSLP